MCACPHCDWLETHDLRTPIRATESTLQKAGTLETEVKPASTEESWWDSVLSWFSHEKSDGVDSVSNNVERDKVEGDSSWWNAISSWFDDAYEVNRRRGGVDQTSRPRSADR